MLALPAEAGGLRQRFLHHRRGIDEDLDAGRFAGGTAVGRRAYQPAGEGFQPRLDDVVIVAPERIDRHRADLAVRRVPQRIERRGIAGAEQDDRAHRRPQRRGRTAPCLGVGHPQHVAVPPVVEPVAQARRRQRGCVGRGDAELREAEPCGFGGKARAEIGRRHFRPIRRLMLHRKLQRQSQAATVAVPRRRKAVPAMAKPVIISAQLAGSGTEVTSKLTPVES